MSEREGKPLPYKYEFFAKGSRPMVARYPGTNLTP